MLVAEREMDRNSPSWYITERSGDAYREMIVDTELADDVSTRILGILNNQDASADFISAQLRLPLSTVIDVLVFLERYGYVGR